MKRIWYHGAGCRDGFTAAWIARNRFGTSDAIYVPVNHVDPRPVCEEGDEVYILDFCYDRDELLCLSRVARKVVILDHHESAEKHLTSGLLSNTVVVYDIRKSGARLAWEYFNPNSAAPMLVSYVEDRDLWRHMLAWTKEINASIRSYKMDWSMWSLLHERLEANKGRGEMINDGTAILRAEQELVDTHVRNARNVMISGWQVKCVNTTVLQSEIGHKLSLGHPFSATYFIKQSGEVIWCLRSDDIGINVCDLAKLFGGGGHKHSAGFKSDLSFLARILENKPDVTADILKTPDRPA